MFSQIRLVLYLLNLRMGIIYRMVIRRENPGQHWWSECQNQHFTVCLSIVVQGSCQHCKPSQWTDVQNVSTNNGTESTFMFSGKPTDMHYYAFSILTSQTYGDSIFFLSNIKDILIFSVWSPTFFKISPLKYWLQYLLCVAQKKNML